MHCNLTTHFTSNNTNPYIKKVQFKKDIKKSNNIIRCQINVIINNIVYEYYLWVK